MQLAPATTLAGLEPASHTAGDGQTTEAAVSDVFAALLAALAPAAPAMTGGPAGIAVGEGKPENGDADGSQAPAPATPTGLPVPSLDVMEPLVPTGRAGSLGLIEVPRDAAGLPLLAAWPSPAGLSSLVESPAETPAPGPATTVAVADGVPAEAGTTVADPVAPTAAGRQPAQLAPTMIGAAVGVERLAEPEASKIKVAPGDRAAKPDPALTPAANGSAYENPEGRPVRTTPVPTLGVTVKTEAMPDPEGGSPREGDAAVKAPAPGDTDLRPADPPSPTTGSATPVASPEPRPPVWQPDTGTAAGTTVTPAAGPDIASTANGPAGVPVGDTVTPRSPDPQHIQAQVLRQVLGRFEAADGRPQQIVLQLAPEHLGKVEVRLTSSGETLQVEFVAESAEAGQALREGHQDLVRSLTAQSGRWQHVEVKVVEPERPSARSDDKDEERSEQSNRRERDQHQRRRHGDDR